MSASSLAADERAPWRSASTIVAGVVTGYHVLKIIGYSRTKDVPNGKHIKSRPFRVGVRNWHVHYYPNGTVADVIDCISLFLILDDTILEPVKARVKFSLLDQDGKASHTLTTETVDFTEKRNWGYPNFIKRDVLEKSAHLKNDSFTVRFDVTIMKDVHTEEIPFIVVPPSDMHQHFAQLLSSKQGADVKFRVGRKTFSAHRLVLATRSPVFKAQLFGPMQESTTTKAIPIDDMEAEVFSALLTFIYTDSLPKMKEEEESSMVQHLLVAADRYNMDRLKLICEDKLCKHIDTDSAATILALAEQHSCHGLKGACLEFLRSSKNLEAAMETDGFGYLTSSCPSVLKELISKAH